MLNLEHKICINVIKKVSDRTSDFTGREWVFQAIHQWLSDPSDSRYFLITGEPSAGKTAISDRLTQFSQSVDPLHPYLLPSFLSAIHHCSARDSTSVDPKTCARKIACQLVETIPPFAQALKDIGEKQVNIHVDLSVGTANDNTIQAVVIHDLSLSGVMTAQEAFNWVVLNPRHATYQAGFDHPIDILVNALDEALTHESDRTIVDLLSKLENLPPKVRLILLIQADQFSAYPFKLHLDLQSNRNRLSLRSSTRCPNHRLVSPRLKKNWQCPFLPYQSNYLE